MESRPFQFLFEERNIVLYKMQRIRRRGLLAELIAQEIKKTLVGFEARYVDNNFSVETYDRIFRHGK